MPRITRSKSNNDEASSMESTKKPKNGAKTQSLETHPKMIVSMVPDGLVAKDKTSFSFVPLPHPRTSQPVLVVFSENDGSLFEVNTFTDGKRSWFIGDSVEPEGKFYMLTPLDPIFLALPYLIKAERLSPIDQTLHDEKFPNVRRLMTCSNFSLTSVADQKGPEELQVFKYNEDKTLVWLEKKTRHVAKALENRNVNVNSGSSAATFVKSSDSNPEHVLRFAFEMVSEYIPPELGRTLAQHMGIEFSPKGSTSLSASNSEGPPPKRAKTEPTEDYSQNNKNQLMKPKAVSAKEKARSEAAKGSKSIMSFFGKK